MTEQKKETLTSFVDRTKSREIFVRETEPITTYLEKALTDLSDITIRDRFTAIHASLEKHGQKQVKLEPAEQSPLVVTTHKTVPNNTGEPFFSSDLLSTEELLYFRQNMRKKLELMVFELAAESVWFAPARLAKKNGATDDEAKQLLQSQPDFEQVVLRESVERINALWADTEQPQAEASQMRVASKIMDGLLLHTYDNEAVIGILREGYEYLYEKRGDPADLIDTQAKFSAQLIFNHLPSAVWHMLSILTAASQMFWAQSMYETYSSGSEEDRQHAPPKLSKKALSSMSHRVIDYWLSTFDDYFKGRGRPPIEKDEVEIARKQKKQELRKKVMDAFVQMGSEKSAAQIAYHVGIRSGKPESRARMLRRELSAVGLSFERMQAEAKFGLNGRT
jgi:hypothetical protein